MKILHICLCGPVTDGWSYQDNLITKYHAKLGHEVTIIASEWIFDAKGKIIKTNKLNYINEDNVKMIRLKSKYFTNINSKFRYYYGLTEYLSQQTPDVIFIHGCHFFGIKDICKYAQKNKDITIYLDNHSDFSNSATNWLSKYILHGVVWKHYAQMIAPYTKKFYGVLPARVDFLAEMYKLPPNKIELLVMGIDDEKISEAKSDSTKNYIREKYNISKDDFLIITGGKIDAAKKQTLLLMEAIKRINRNNVKLIVFGSVVEELMGEINSLCDSKNIQYIGWIQPQETYSYFASADMVVFPGRHSVLWEQVAGLGVPMIVKHWQGTTHVDVGGNCEFLYKDSVEEIEKKIVSIIDDPIKYKDMKSVSATKAMDVFSYKSIAERSIREG